MVTFHIPPDNLPRVLCNYSLTKFFYLRVWLFLEKKKNLNNLIRGGFESTSGHNFYMGT